MVEANRTADYSHLNVSEINAPTLVDTVAEHLRGSILAGQFSPGERLYEAALARQFGISRGPIREALALLEGDGLVENEPRKGKFVRALDERIIDEIYSLRRALEPYAAEIIIESLNREIRDSLDEALDGIRLAAETGDRYQMARSDLAFHHRLYQLSGHRPLLRVWDDIVSGSLQMLVSITTPTHPIGDSVLNHQLIIDSIASGDPERTRAILVRHIEDGWERARVAVKELSSDS
jgi:GntR family transcriptional regulator, gluconate operon transcriptional repressor